jgi:hypothetical protein
MTYPIVSQLFCKPRQFYPTVLFKDLLLTSGFWLLLFARRYVLKIEIVAKRHLL